MSDALTQTPKKAIAVAGLTFADHPAFHSTVRRAVTGGAAGALIADLCSRAIGMGANFSLLVTLVAAGALTAVGLQGKGLLRAAVGATLGLAGGLLHGACMPQWPWFGALLLGEPLTLNFVAGGLAIVLGIVLVSR